MNAHDDDSLDSLMLTCLDVIFAMGAGVLGIILWSLFA